MKTSVLAAALVLATCGAAFAAPGGPGSSSSWDAATRNSNSKNYLTLFEQPNFGGRQFTFVGAPRRSRSGTEGANRRRTASRALPTPWRCGL